MYGCLVLDFPRFFFYGRRVETDVEEGREGENTDGSLDQRRIRSFVWREKK